MLQAQRLHDVKPSAYRVDLTWGPRGVESYVVVVEEESGQWAWCCDGAWEPFGGLLAHSRAVVRRLGKQYASLRS